MKITVLILFIILQSGCAWYSHTGPLTPDGLNITDYRVPGSPIKNDTIGIGLSWSLKDK